jgi:serpin B
MKYIPSLVAVFLAFATSRPPAAFAGGNAADQAALVKGNNQFAFDLYAQVRQRDGNLFFSPYSISTALAMTYGGARGNTAAQMAKTLHFTLDPPDLHPAFAALNRQVFGRGKRRGYQLRLANALWGQRSYFRADFLKLTKDHYGAGQTELDFEADPEAARQTINSWVEKHTENKIRDLIARGMIDEYTRFVLTNAIYFKADWVSKFDKKDTKAAPFRLADGSKVNVPTMHYYEVEFKSMAEKGFQALELPYAGKALSMVLFVPDRTEGLAKFEKSLTAANVAKWLAKLKPEAFGEVAMPKFRTTSTLPLHDKKILPAMGMPDAFKSEAADFSRLTDNKGWRLTFVIHKAFVDVNEEGTEAAAATAVGGGAEEEPPSFRLDCPFIFLIRDNRSGTILFLGRVMDPRK